MWQLSNKIASTSAKEARRGLLAAANARHCIPAAANARHCILTSELRAYWLKQARMELLGVSAYNKWLRYYMDCCAANEKTL